MFCQNCGKQIEEGTHFCPNCGSQIGSSTGTQPPDMSVQQKNASSKQKTAPKKKHKLLLPIIIAAAGIMMVFTLAVGGSSSPDTDKMIEMVQNGYLGHYDTVTVKEVLEYVYQDGEWNTGEAAEGTHYIVEYEGPTGGMQFSIEGADAETFLISGVRADGLDVSGMEASDIKLYVDSLYEQYAGNFPEKGLNIDKSLSNNTMGGHIGPVKSADESAYAVKYLSSQITKDLSAYVDYSEEQLIAELGFKKNEFGCYPEDTHMNFAFTDGKMYMIMLNASHPEDMGMSLYDVALKDSMEEADAILKKKGFRCENSYDISGESTALYINNETGYGLSISSNEQDGITSIGYMKETDLMPSADETDYSSVEETVDSVLDYSDELADSSKGEAAAIASDDDQITPRTMVDGNYIYDDGSSCVCIAEVGFSPDRGGNYIYIECWGYGGHELIDFEGVLEENDDGSYYAYYDVLEGSINVVFVEGGLYVQTSGSDIADMYSMEGYYILEAQ